MARVTHLADLMHRAEASNGTAIPSNWILSTDGTKALAWRPETTSSGAVSYGSNATHVSDSSDGGAATTASRSDHRHLGLRSVSHASNTFFGDLTLQTEGGLYIVKPGPGILKFGSTGGGAAGGGGTTITVEEADGSPTGSVSKLVLPNGTLSIVGSTATYTPAGGSGPTHSYVGYNTVGGSWETAAVNEWAIAKQIVLASACWITEVEAYIQIGSAGKIASLIPALYTDSGGNPAQPFRTHPSASTASNVVGLPATTPMWLGTGGLGWVAAGTYWIVIRTTDGGGTQLPQIAYDSGSDQTQDFPAADFPIWGGSSASRKYSIRVGILT